MPSEMSSDAVFKLLYVQGLKILVRLEVKRESNRTTERDDFFLASHAAEFLRAV